MVINVSTAPISLDNNLLIPNHDEAGNIATGGIVVEITRLATIGIRERRGVQIPLQGIGLR